MVRFSLVTCLALCLLGQGLAGWNGYGKTRFGFSSRGNQKGSGFGSGKGAWQDSTYTWEAGYAAALQEVSKKRPKKKKPVS